MKLLRYGLAGVGPIGAAGAQFLLSVHLLHSLEPAAFGLFTFLTVIVQLSLGAWSALFAAPMPLLLAQGSDLERAETRRGLLSANLIFCVASILIFAAVAWGLHASPAVDLVFGGYAALMLMRSFARALAYSSGLQGRSVASDGIYSVALLAGTALIVIGKTHDLTAPFVALLVSAAVSLLAFGSAFAREQLAVRLGEAKRYLAVWRAHSRWALLGVVTTEATANAHAYIVTALGGSAAFAPLAAAALLMRPVSLVTNALTDWERPQLGRRVAAGDHAGATSSVRLFRAMLVLAWIGTVAVAAGLVIWAPTLLFPPKYDRTVLMTGMILSLAVALIRLLRSPESVLLQAAGEFRPLANASLVCCFVSVILVVLMVWLWTPVWSLLGIFAGEAIFAVSIWRACARWSAQARGGRLAGERPARGGILEEQAQT